jgi:very-short-patch-repair endonuclease
MANEFARRLRREMTESEKAFWKNIRGRRFHGFKIRRQVPIGPYIADFACYEVRIVFEIDGGSHLDSVARDDERSRWLNGNGWRVLRFWNNEVTNEWKTVEEVIWNALNGVERPPLPANERLTAADTPHP